MKMFNDEKADRYLIACELKREFDINISTEAVENILYDYIIYKKKEKQKTGFLWRLTIPFYLASLLLIILYFPFQWIFTGSYGLSRDKNIGKVINNWKEKMF